MNDQIKIDEVLRALDQSCPFCSHQKGAWYLFFFGPEPLIRTCNTHLLEVKQRIERQPTIPSNSFVAVLQDELYHRGLE